MRYSKDLSHLTSIRISHRLREQAEHAAEIQGLTFSEFVRQSLNRNIHVAQKIEDEIKDRLVRKTMGM